MILSNNKINQFGFFLVILYIWLAIANVMYFKGDSVFAKYFFYCIVFFCFYQIIKSLVLEKIYIGKIYYILLLLLMLLIVWLQSVFFENTVDRFGRHALTYVADLLKSCFFWSFVGVIVAYGYLRQSAFLSLLMIIACIIMLFSGASGGILVDYQALSIAHNVEELTHLNLEDYVVFLCILSYVIAPKYLKPLIALLVVFALFMVGGRAALFSMVLSILIFEWFIWKKKVLVIYFILFLVLMVFSSFISVYIDFSNDYVRRILVLDGIVGDASTQGRAEIWQESVYYLYQQFLIGNPSIIINSLGSLGEYIHNLLSLWQFFGFFAFAFVVFLLFYFCRHILKEINQKNEDKTIDLGAFILIYTLINVCFAKYVGFPFLWIMIGFGCFFNVQERRVNRC